MVAEHNCRIEQDKWYMNLLYFGVLAMVASSISASDIAIEAAPAPEYDAIFQQTKGWIGADGDYSVQIDDNRTLWLYSDTFVGTVQNDKRINSTLINNSIAIQHIDNSKPVEFIYRTDSEGKPAAFITPEDGQGYFWLFAGAATSTGIYMFLTRVKHSDSNPYFPFKTFGMALGHVTNPMDPPLKWHITQTQVPFCKFTDHGAILFGSAAMKVGSDVYIYGFDSFSSDDAGKRVSSMIVARVPEDKLGDYSFWRFYGGGKWHSNATVCEPLFENTPTEFSVSYVPGIKQYAVVYTDGGIFGNIMVRLAPKPEGPWGEAQKVFRCPDQDWHENAFSYAVKGHPELSTNPNELIVTYATNSTEFADMFNDARLYWPRFVRLTFKR